MSLAPDLAFCTPASNILFIPFKAKDPLKAPFLFFFKEGSTLLLPEAVLFSSKTESVSIDSDGVSSSSLSSTDIEPSLTVLSSFSSLSYSSSASESLSPSPPS